MGLITLPYLGLRHVKPPNGPPTVAPLVEGDHAAGTAYSAAAGSRSAGPGTTTPRASLSNNVTWSFSGFADAAKETLREAYRGRFPKPSSENYSAEIIEDIVPDIPCYLPHFHARLLEAFAEAPQDKRGTLDQLYNAMAIEDLFSFDALQDPEGSPDYARLQRRLLQAAAEEDQPRRLSAFRSIFQAMESGQLLGEKDTLRHISALAERGMPPEEIARAINGTEHTAGLNDMRLARRVVSVSLDVRRFLQEPGLREDSHERFRRAIWNFVRSERPFTTAEIFTLLEVNPSPQIAVLKKAWQEKRLAIEILSGKEFNAWVARWGQASDCRTALFIRGGPKNPDRILVRDVPRTRSVSEMDLAPVVSQTVSRIRAVPHDGGHWGDTVGHYEGIEKDSKPIDIHLAQINRHERLVSEIMACFSSYAWKVRNLIDDDGEVAKRRGDTLARYFRSLAERAY